MFVSKTHLEHFQIIIQATAILCLLLIVQVTGR